MQKENPKYRTHDSPPYVDPPTVWPPSMTDGSQDISVARLVADHLRKGGLSPEESMAFGEDYSKLDLIELQARRELLNKQLESRVGELEAEATAAAGSAAAAAAGRPAEISPAPSSQMIPASQQPGSAQLQPGSPELQRLAAELTRILPGFNAAVLSSKGGQS